MNRKTVAEAFWNAELEDELFKRGWLIQGMQEQGETEPDRYNTRYDTIHDTHCNMILPVGYLHEHIKEAPPNT